MTRIVLKNSSHRGLWKRNTLHGRFLASRDRAETADAQQKSWDLRQSSIWTSLKKERRGQHKGHLFFDFAFKKSPADLDYFSWSLAPNWFHEFFEIGQKLMLITNNELKKFVKSRCWLGYSAEIRILYWRLGQFHKIREINAGYLYQGLDQSTKGFFMFDWEIKTRNRFLGFIPSK